MADDELEKFSCLISDARSIAKKRSWETIGYFLDLAVLELAREIAPPLCDPNAPEELPSLFPWRKPSGR